MGIPICVRVMTATCWTKTRKHVHISGFKFIQCNASAPGSVIPSRNRMFSWIAALKAFSGKQEMMHWWRGHVSFGKTFYCVNSLIYNRWQMFHHVLTYVANRLFFRKRLLPAAAFRAGGFLSKWLPVPESQTSAVVLFHVQACVRRATPANVCASFCRFSLLFFPIGFGPLGSDQKRTSCNHQGVSPSGSATCDQGNNNCQHICVDDGLSRVCMCHDGYVLNADQATCSRKRRSPDAVCGSVSCRFWVL